IVYILAIVVACCSNAVKGGDHPDGQSQVSREQDALGNYRFSYNVANPEGEQFRSEGTDALGRVVGSYGLKHIDGTHRVVEYVADKDGFRAEVRSNEPGVISAEAAGASIIKTDEHNPPLTVSASSDDAARETFGKRLSPQDTSRVSYVSASDSNDQTMREQRNFDDYRPLNPVAYYPAQAPSTDPHTAVRRPGYYSPRDRVPDRDYRLSTTSRRPFIPPYGGFDDDEEPEIRRPGVTMTTIHGGRAVPPTPPTPSHGSGRIPFSGVIPDQRDFPLPRFPIRSGYPSGIPRNPVARDILPSYPNQGIPPPSVLFNPPSYDEGIGSPNFVLRAVPIPNGIQAVRVDPTTGRVYERLVYPLFLRQDGRPVYDRNILLHNDDVSDDHSIRGDDDSGYFDIPTLSGRPFRSARNQPFDDNDYRLNNTMHTDIIDEKNSYHLIKDIARYRHPVVHSGKARQKRLNVESFKLSVLIVKLDIKRKMILTTTDLNCRNRPNSK
ncbi:cuticle protein 14 isoform a, partial [Trichonephila inaurata madagascariensis]